MRLEDLKMFTSIVKAGSLHGAAQGAGITQSAMTKAVQRLELEFGVQLLNRSRRGIELTAAGQALTARTMQLEMSVDDLRTEMLAIKSAESGLVRIGTIPAVLESTLIPVLATCRQRKPDIHFQVRAQTSAQLIAQLQAGELDLAICLAPESIPEEVQAEHIALLRHHIVCRRGHPMADGGNLEMLSRADWLLPPQDVAIRLSIQGFFAKAGFPLPRPCIEADGSQAWYAELLRQTDMVTIFTELMLSRHRQHLQALPFAAIPLTRDLHIFYRRAAYMSPSVQEVRQLVKQHAAAARH
ncbi:MAG: LysR family transcriptional regulator [Rhodoferax sp.]|nr:LysR family transcriptional regulator [Rhodoferax sp.]